MPVEYRDLVTKALEKGLYPALRDFVVVDVFYKTIPNERVSENVKSYDRRYDDPSDVWIREAKPFALNYLVDTCSNAFYHHETQTLNTETFPLQCQRIKLHRAGVDGFLQRPPSPTFEDEIYTFITLLNFNVAKIAPLLDLDFVSSTRFLPQFIRTWVYKYDVKTITAATAGTSVSKRFGPPPLPASQQVIPIRVFRGLLSPCTSRSVLLSLNDDAARVIPYTMHFSVQWKAMIPLAYNPLENPIIV